MFLWFLRDLDDVFERVNGAVGGGFGVRGGQFGETGVGREE